MTFDPALCSGCQRDDIDFDLVKTKVTSNRPVENTDASYWHHPQCTMLAFMRSLWGKDISQDELEEQYMMTDVRHDRTWDEQRQYAFWVACEGIIRAIKCQSPAGIRRSDRVQRWMNLLDAVEKAHSATIEILNRPNALDEFLDTPYAEDIAKNRLLKIVADLTDQPTSRAVNAH